MEDVLGWVKSVGFDDYLAFFKESEVDGDLLLQLDEANIKEDLQITNGIHRKRFVRELDKLKKTADFSHCDKHGIASFLQDHPQLGDEFLVYTYGLVLQGLSMDLMKKLNPSSLDDMLREAGVHSAVHRQRIGEAVLDECGSSNLDQEVDRLSGPTYDAYICNASPFSHGSDELASLIDVNLRLRGFRTVKFGGSNVPNKDSERSEVIRRCKNFILILTKGSLEGYDKNPDAKTAKMVIYNDLLTALNTKNCNIIPVVDPDFQFPDPEDLPEDIRQVLSFNAIRWIHEYQDASIGKLERFIRSESSPSNLKLSETYTNRLHSSTPSFLTVNYGSRSRNDSGRSTPTNQPHIYRKRGSISPNPMDKYRRRNASIGCLVAHWS